MRPLPVLTLSCAVAGVLVGVGAVALPAHAVAGAGESAPRRPAPATAPAPAPVRAPAPQTTPTPPATPPSAGSGWDELDAAVARIPGIVTARPARWSAVGRTHPWGQTVWPWDDVTVSRSTPSDRLDDVVRHEWSHVLQDRAYGHDTGALTAETDRVFGGTGTLGAERAADCMARELGARWTHYTTCPDPAQRAAARRLLGGQRLPPG